MPELFTTLVVEERISSKVSVHGRATQDADQKSPKVPRNDTAGLKLDRFAPR